LINIKLNRRTTADVNGRLLKTWMQTYLVHTREPRRLHAELGWRGSVGFHALMGGLILSALVHPLFYGLLAYFLIMGELLIPAESNVGAAFQAVAWVNLGVGYVISILIGVLSVWRRLVPAHASLLAADLARCLSRALSARAQRLPLGEDAPSRRGATQIRVTDSGCGRRPSFRSGSNRDQCLPPNAELVEARHRRTHPPFDGLRAAVSCFYMNRKDASWA
jgi:hypothetical protein